MQDGFLLLTELFGADRWSRPAVKSLAVLGLGVALSVPSFSADQQAPRESVAADQSKASEAIFFAGPPKGFNPLVASDTELATYGFPPRPDSTHREQYAKWQKLVTAPQTRLTDVKVQATTMIAGVPKAVNKAAVAPGKGAVATSSNWSGYAIAANSGTFTANNSFIFAEWLIPVAQQAFGTCNGNWDYSVNWVGFDGWGSGDVLQAGSEADAYCSGGTKSTFYSLWYEWFVSGCTVNTATQPCYMWRTSLAAAPGDVVGVEVWYTTSAPQGHAYIVNYTTQQTISLAFSEPSGAASYVGNSAEWIVERPGVGGGLPDLTNYVVTPFSFDYAYNGSSYFYPGSSPAGTTIYSITMTCPPWNPASACTYPGLSYATLNGLWQLWFDDEGAAY